MFEKSELGRYEYFQETIKQNNGPLLGFDEDWANAFSLEFNQEESGSNDVIISPKRQKVDQTKSDIGTLKYHVRQLESPAPIAIGGYMISHLQRIHMSLKLPTSNKNTNDPFVQVGNLQSLDVKDIIPFCDPSRYGENQLKSKLLYSSLCPTAVQCPAERIQIDDTLISRQIKTTIERHLLLQCYCVDLVLTKLNVYSENSHFKPHSDTSTHDPSEFLGTVMVCLPSAHEGGDLIVRHAGREAVFDFATRSQETSIVQFAAFFGDCQHEVQRVVAGHRITLTYSILQNSTVAAKRSLRREIGLRCEVHVTTGNNSLMLQRSADEMNTIKHKVITELRRSIGSGCVGVYLSHAYTDINLTATNLKGVDKVLYDCLVENNIPVSLVTVLLCVYYTTYHPDHWQYRTPKEYFDQSDAVFDVRLLTGFGSDPRIPVHRAVTDIPFLTTWEVGSVLVTEEDSENCYASKKYLKAGCVDRLYLLAAMIIGPAPVAIP